MIVKDHRSITKRICASRLVDYAFLDIVQIHYQDNTYRRIAKDDGFFLFYLCSDNMSLPKMYLTAFYKNTQCHSGLLPVQSVWIKLYVFCTNVSLPLGRRFKQTHSPNPATNLLNLRRNPISTKAFFLLGSLRGLFTFAFICIHFSPLL